MNAQELQHSRQQQGLQINTLQQGKQAALQERDELRQKAAQHKAESAQQVTIVQELRAAAADLADELQSARSAAGRHFGQSAALRELSAEHAVTTAELAAKAAAVDSLKASVAQLQAELAVGCRKLAA